MRLNRRTHREHGACPGATFFFLLMPSIEHPLVFMAEQLADARNALRLPSQDLPDFDVETLSGTLLPDSTTITLLSRLVKRLVTVSHELSGVT